MVICKFYLQGNCRFGSSCKFEHSYNSKYSYHAPQKPSAPASQATGVTNEQLVTQVQGDIQSALKGGQWILSGYSPFKKGSFPGLIDLSPEEARLCIYEAKANNNVDQMVAHMNNLFKEARQKYEQLLLPDPAILNVLRTLYKGEPATSPFSQNSGFGSSSSAATSVFRSAVQESSVFGQNQNPASIFAQANQNTAASIFGQANQNAASLFGQANQSAFGQSGQANAFGQTSPSNAAASVFGQANQSNQNATSPFGQSTQNAASIFGQANSAISANVNSPQSVFAQTAQNQNSFGSTSPFSQTSEPRSIFAQANQTQPQNVFQTQQPTQASVFGSMPFASKPSDPFSQPVASDAYSKLEELSESDLEAFKSSDFKLGFIPELPPPLELCS